MSSPIFDSSTAGSWQITAITIDGLDCQIVGYPDSESGYAVQVKLTNPQTFRSEYELKSFEYKISAIGDATKTVEYGATLPNGAKYLQIEFWKSISNLKEWNEAFSEDKIDLAGNYQITADIDFSGTSADKVAQISRKSLGSGNYEVFTGSLRGAAGADRTGTPTLRNYPAEKGYIIEAMEGSSLTNLKIDGLTLAVTGVNTSMGLIGTASQTDISHVELHNVEISSASSAAGALAGIPERQYGILQLWRQEWRLRQHSRRVRL